MGGGGGLGAGAEGNGVVGGWVGVAPLRACRRCFSPPPHCPHHPPAAPSPALPTTTRAPATRAAPRSEFHLVFLVARLGFRGCISTTFLVARGGFRGPISTPRFLVPLLSF